jgi:hypothetical protein
MAMLEDEDHVPRAAGTNRRISITKRQRESDLGAELLSLCQSTTADGRFSDEEIGFLREWLEAHRREDLPAISHLIPVVERITADGVITPDERRGMYMAVEMVLPPDVRSVAQRARRSVDEQEKERLRVERALERERAQQERNRNESLLRLDFMVAGVRHEGRPALIERHVREGDDVRLKRAPENPHSDHAIEVRTADGHHIGFVPDDDAGELASLLDGGYPYRARVKKILTGGRYPIPVVIADVFLKIADVPLLSWPEQQMGSAARPTATSGNGSSANPGGKAYVRPSYSLGRFLGRHSKLLAVAIGLIVAYFVFR